MLESIALVLIGFALGVVSVLLWQRRPRRKRPVLVNGRRQRL